MYPCHGHVPLHPRRTIKDYFMYSILIAIALFCGLLSGPLSVRILNRMPDRSFCDYDETPTEIHRSPRFSCRRQGWGVGLFLGVVYVLLLVRFGLTLQWVFLCLHCLVLAMISLSDLRFSIIPDELLIAAGVCALGAALCHVVAAPALGTALVYVLGAVIGAGLILVLNLLGRLIYGKDALGMGDLKLLAVCGIACGHTGILIAALMGIFAAGIFFAVAMALKRMKSDQFYPLGPFLVLGVCLTLMFRPVIDAAFQWYLSLL